MHSNVTAELLLVAESPNWVPLQKNILFLYQRFSG